MIMKKQDLKPKFIITIDGYSSTGKSSFARQIAQRYGMLHIDTGALYRIVTLHAIRQGLMDENHQVDIEKLAVSLTHTQIGLRPAGITCDVIYDGQAAGNEIRSMEVSDQVSYIAAIQQIRDYVNDILYRFSTDHCIVVDGRDMGTAVFPAADLKIFMTASKEVRAQRRMEELRAKDPGITYEEVLDNLIKRDTLDETREIAPLRKAEDALVLDNTDMTMEDQLEWLDNILRERGIKCK